MSSIVTVAVAVAIPVFTVVPLSLALLLRLALLRLAAEGDMPAVFATPRVPFVVGAEVRGVLGAVGNFLAVALGFLHRLPHALVLVPDLAFGALAATRFVVPILVRRASWMRGAHLSDLLVDVLRLAAEGLRALVVVAKLVVLVILAPLVLGLGTILLLPVAALVLLMRLGMASLLLIVVTIVIIVAIVVVVIVALALAMKSEIGHSGVADAPIAFQEARVAAATAWGSDGNAGEGRECSDKQFGDEHGCDVVQERARSKLKRLLSDGGDC